MSRALLCAGLAGALTFAPGRPAVPAAPESETARLVRAAEEHPDDPDLAWAAALALARAGDPAGVERLAELEARWPGLHREAALELGKALAVAGRDAEALAAFERAVARDPEAGDAHLHRALALRRLGRPLEAEDALERVAAFEPALAAEALLLRGVSRVEQGDVQEGRRLLRAVIELDAGSEVASRARILLGPEPGASRGRRLSLMAQSGFEYDSNVTLDSGLPIAGTGSNRRDVRSAFAAGTLVQLLRGERVGLALGYRFDGSLHFDLSDYDVENHLLLASAGLRAGERLTLRVEGAYDYARLDDDGYARSLLLRPALFWALPERFGVLRLYGDVGRQAYFEPPSLSSLDRDGLAWGVGVEHTASVPLWPEALTALGGRFSRLDTDADRDLLGFEGAYDHSRWEGDFAVEAPLPGRLRARAAVGLGWERYDHENVIDFLTDLSAGTPSLVARRDWVTDASLSLVRPLRRNLDVEAGWRFTHRDSNVELYAYDRHVFGVHFRVHVD